MWTLYIFVLILPLAVAASGNICTLPPVTGPCRAAFRRWFYNSKPQQCQQFIYGGCQGNANNFKTEMECRNECGNICTLPPVTGPCRAAFRRWFYNSKTKQCEQFTYGGCQGNANNFKTEMECRNACGGPCTLPPDSGPCEAAIKRWFYNSRTKQCETFIYGGCQGNANNFITAIDCRKACGKAVCNDIDCSNTHCPAGVKKDANGCSNKKCQCNCPCKNKKCEGNLNCVLREDHECKSCPMVAVCDYKLCSIGELFSFPGCAFIKRDCPSGFTCRWSPVDAPHGCCPNDACHANPNSGCGTKKTMRWYYDFKKKSCFKFRFGGKGGNKNKFKSNKACMRKCGKK